MTDTSNVSRPGNPYGGVPSGGMTLPPYYRPTPDLASNNLYYPGQEELNPDEMRISFIGSTPIPVTKSQAGTCIMVELGNGKRFFFDFGSGCMRNIIAMAVPLPTVNDIFFTHLHVDHYADLPYLYAFSPWVGRWKPLRVHGPSGRTPQDGIAHMIEGMKMMTHWHTDSFNAVPIGDGYEVEVNEFDHTDDNGICYDQDGVTIRHWRRSHTKDGASAYRLDWNGLSFVWTGDGRPDKLTLELAQGVDVFVTEVQPDTGNLQALKFGMPPIMLNNTIDQAHSVHYAVGYMFEKIQPRLAMVTHLSFDEELVPEIVAGHPSSLQRALPVRRARRGCRQCRQGFDLDPQGGDPGRRQHVAPDPEGSGPVVRLDPGQPHGDVPDAAVPHGRQPRSGGLQPRDRSEGVLPVGSVSRADGRLPGGRHDRCPRGRAPEVAAHAREARRQGRPPGRRHQCHRAARRRRQRAAGAHAVMTASEHVRTEAIPLTVLTGFLGAGKTTLLNRILSGDHGLRIAVLVNDFGSINIDADLVVGVESDGDIISLANGCVCCNVRDDLVGAVTQLITRPEQPEYIVLEASGVAEPSSIALTFMGEELRDRIRLDSIMCVVDAEQVFAVPEMMELKLRQVAFADMLILNKVDLVSPEEIERIKAWLDDRFHRYRLVEACNGDVPLEILLSAGRFDPAQLENAARG